MPQPPLTILDVTPQQVGWDAVVQSNFQNLKAHLIAQPLTIPIYTIAGGSSQLPTAADYPFSLAMVSDPAGGKPPLVISVGTSWIYLDGSTAL